MPTLPQNATTPSSQTEPERRYVSHPIATCWSQVPMTESPCPMKNSRKFR